MNIKLVAVLQGKPMDEFSPNYQDMLTTNRSRGGCVVEGISQYLAIFYSDKLFH